MNYPEFFTYGAYPEAQSMNIERFSIDDAAFFEPKVEGLLDKAQMIVSLAKELEGAGCALGLLTAVDKAVHEFMMWFPAPGDFPREDCLLTIEKGMFRCHGYLNLAAQIIELVEISNPQMKSAFDNFCKDFHLMERTIAMMLSIYCWKQQCA